MVDTFRLASILLTAASPLPDVTPETIIGQHVVMKGETLYCIGRGYAVLPGAIAKVNGLSGSSILSIGQVLNIPAARWVNVPAGPVCTPQFQSPFTGLAPSSSSPTTSAPTTATPTPPVTILAPASGSATYTVQRGDTLFRIGLRFGVTVANLKAANGLIGNTIFVGQVLVIPGRGSEGTGGGGGGGSIGGYSCPNGAACVLGNIKSDGERIYHFPGCPNYTQVEINISNGERLFTTSAEAEAAGWRRSLNCP
jgi:LysM repeat protein